MKKTGIFLAEGFEEIEALTVVDVLRRAQIEVNMISIGCDRVVEGAHGIRVEADEVLAQADTDALDLLILPGGMPGTIYLGECRELTECVKRADAQKRGIAAICAAPSVLGDLGLLSGRKAVCYPGFESRLTGATVLTVPVVTDGHITTSRGMGTAIDFALELVTRLAGADEAKKVADSILYRA